MNLRTRYASLKSKCQSALSYKSMVGKPRRTLMAVIKECTKALNNKVRMSHTTINNLERVVDKILEK